MRTPNRILLGLLVLMSAAVLGCGVFTKPAPIHFILPNGFLGEIRLIYDPKSGVDVTPVNGRFAYQIPQSGVLKVTSFRPFEEMREWTVAYSDGTPVPMEVESYVGPHGEAPTVSADAIMFCGGSFIEANGLPPEERFFVGTKSEYEKWQREDFSY